MRLPSDSMSVGGQGEKLVEWSEVAKHGYRESCWVVIHGQVYDITHFLAEHPGGMDILLDVAGTDGTELFEDIGHTASARAKMATYCIGRLETHDLPTYRPDCGGVNSMHC